MPFADPAKRKEYHAVASKTWAEANPERRRELNRSYDEKRDATPERTKQKAEVRHRRHIRERVRVIEMYGGCCEFCGCGQYEYLTLDHVQGDGKQHRAEIASRYRTVYDYILRENILDRSRFRLLCWNCHMAWTRFKVAPGAEELHDMAWWRNRGALRYNKEEADV